MEKFIINMVRYYFICDKEHTFDAWFKNIEFFEEQVKTVGNIVCPICGSVNVSRQITAPSILKRSSKVSKSSSNNKTDVTDVELLNQYLTAFNDYVESNFSYVGDKFKKMALQMHKGEIKKDNIYGEANKEDIEELKEEGVNVISFAKKPISHNKIN